MRLLLDTHALIWWLENSDELDHRAREAIADVQNSVFVSAASAWKIAIKKQLGKLMAPDDLSTQIDRHGFAPLNITVAHASAAGSLPGHHRDPSIAC